MPDSTRNLLRSSRVRARVVWLIFVAMLALFGALFTQNLVEQRTALRNTEEHRLQTQVRILDFLFSQQLTSIVDALRDIANETRDWKSSIDVRTAGSRRLRELEQLLPALRTINLLDRNGIVLASNRAELIGNDFSEREYFSATRLARDTSRVHLSKPFTTVLNAYGINIVVSQQDAAGKFAGAITATLDRDSFAAALETIRYSDDMITGVFTDGGQLFASLPPKFDFTAATGDILPQRLLNEFLTSGSEERVEWGSVIGGSDRALVIRVVKPERLSLDHGLILSTGRSLSDIYAPWWKNVFVAGIAFALIAIGATVALIYYVRRQRAAEFKLAAVNAHRRKVQRDLIESEGRLRRSLDYSHVGIWEWDVATNEVTWSNTIYQILGLTPDQSRPSLDAFFAIVHEEDRARVREAIDTCLAGGGAYDIEHRIMWPDGTIGWLHERGGLIRDDLGKPAKMSGVTIDITERKNAEKLLRKWADAFENCGQGIALTDPVRNTIVACNPAFAKIIRRDPLSLIGMRVIDLHASEFRGIKRKAMSDSDNDGQVRFESEYIGGDGASIPVQIDTVSVKDRSGKVLYRVDTVQDIRDRRRAEEDLRASEERLRRVAASMDDIVYTLDTQQRYTAVYGSWVQRSGFTPDHFLGQAISEIMPAAAAAIHEDANRRALAGESVTYEWAVSADGEDRYFQTSVSPLRDANSTISGIVCVGRDISQRIHAEQALRDSEATLRGFFNSSPFIMGVVELDGDRVIPVANNDAGAQFFTKSLGGAQAEAAPVELWISQYQQALETSNAVRFDYPMTMNDVERHLSVTIAPIPHHHSHPRCCYIVEDVTERHLLESKQRRLQIQLQQAQKMEMIGQLTGGIAHDFNNILASMLGFTTLARDRFGEQLPAKVNDYLQEVQRAGGRARELVEKMLAFARNNKRASQLIQPRDQVEDVVGMLAPVFPASVLVRIHGPRVAPVIKADRVALHESLTNLLINARDAVGGRGRIDVYLGEAKDLKEKMCSSCHAPLHGRYVEIAVHDSGSGISPKVLPRIFDPFFTTKDVGQGTGMGLSMVHGVIHESGGHILVESSVGEGSTFRLLFPIVDGATLEPEAKPLPLRRLPPKHISKKIMVVDDEPSLGRLLGELLGEYGYTPVVYSDPLAALNEFRLSPGDWSAIITDHTMPGITGGELASEALSVRPDMPIIICTGYSNEMNKDIAARMGIRRFFDKPVEVTELIDALAQLTAPTEGARVTH